MRERLYSVYMPTIRRVLPIGLLVLAICQALLSAGDSSLQSELSSLDWGAIQPIYRERLWKVYYNALEHPEQAEATGELGMLLHACDQFGLAAVCYRWARRADPDSFRWPYYQALAESADGRKAEAAAVFRDALRLDSSNLPARLKLAGILTELGNAEESLRVLSDVVLQYPGAASAHYELGRAQTAQHQPQQAVRHLKKACELFPKFGAAHYALAILYRDQDEAANAQQELALFREFQQQSPRLEDPLVDAIDELRFDPKSHLNRGIQLLEADRPGEAIAEFEEALRQDPSLAEAHGNLLAAYMNLGDFAKANEHYLAAIAVNPNLYETHFNFGLLCSQSGKSDLAAAAFQNALDINPFYAEAHNNLAFILANDGRLDAAIDHFEQAIKNQPNYRDAHFNLGQILLMQGRTDEAIPHLRAAVAPPDAQTPSIQFVLAQAYLRAGQAQKSLDFARQAREGASALSQAALVADIERFLLRAKSSGVQP